MKEENENTFYDIKLDSIKKGKKINEINRKKISLSSVKELIDVIEDKTPKCLCIFCDTKHKVLLNNKCSDCWSKNK